MRVSLAAGTLALVLSCLHGAGKLTVEQAIRLREPSDLQFAPDGRKIAFTVQEPPSGRRSLRHIWVYDLPSRSLRQWTSSTRSEHTPRWSPDSRTLAFLSDREEDNQIWLMPAEGGEAVKLTSAKNSVESFRWSRDGRRIAFLATDPRSDAEEKKQRDGDDANVIDVDRKPQRAWTVDVASKAVKRESSGPWHLQDLEWLPDGKHLLVSATDRPAEERRTQQICLLSLDDGHMEPVLAPKGPFRGIQVSPGGDAFAFLSSPGTGPTAQDLYICPLNTRAARNVTGPVKDRPVASFQWLGTAELAVLYGNGFHTQLETTGDKPRRLVSDDSLDVAAFSAAPGGQLAYIAESAASPAELWVEGKRASHFNDGLAEAGLEKPELFRYASFDGLPIEAALFRPAGAAAGKSLPLVVLIHGGPAGSWRNRYDILTQLLAARGCAVMQPNIRGSVGYGQKFLESNRGDWGGNDFKDVMAGVDDLIRRGIADPARLAIAGWSYGGYMAEWAITQTGRFKAAVSGAGMADLATEFGTEARPEGDEWYYGNPYENPDGFRKSSPIFYIKNAKTPTLILQGEADTTDPVSQSQMLYRGLKWFKVPAEFVVYPREPHGLREEKHILDRYRRSVDWIAKYIQP